MYIKLFRPKEQTEGGEEQEEGVGSGRSLLSHLCAPDRSAAYCKLIAISRLNPPIIDSSRQVVARSSRPLPRSCAIQFHSIQCSYSSRPLSQRLDFCLLGTQFGETSISALLRAL